MGMGPTAIKYTLTKASKFSKGTKDSKDIKCTQEIKDNKEPVIVNWVRRTSNQ